MAACWEKRGCDEEMMSRCPHNTPTESCPAECRYAACYLPTHAVAHDINLLLNPELDYDAAVKDNCRYCEFFLTNGPKAGERGDAEKRPGNPNRFIL